MDELLLSISKEKFQEVTEDTIQNFKNLLHGTISLLIKDSQESAQAKQHLFEKLRGLWQVLCDGDYLGLGNSKIIIDASVAYLKHTLFSNEYSDVAVENRTLLQELLCLFLEIVVVRENAFESNVATVRELLADSYEIDEEWPEAAKALSGIPLESGHRAVSSTDKVKIYVRIMRLLLEADDPVSAGAYVNRTTAIIDPVKDGNENILFKTCQARILDSNRSFQKAAWKYFELSCIPAVSEDDRMVALAQSMKCIVLAEAGPQRSRFLATIYKDERSPKVEPKDLFTFIEYLYLDRMISTDLKREFATHLAPHHLAQLSDGSSLLDKAVVEHNIVCCSRFYRTVYFDQLASILDISQSKVELIVGKLVADGNLSATLDQIEGLISFHELDPKDDNKEKDENSATIADICDPVMTLSRDWDEHISSVGTHLEDIFYLLRSKYPEWIVSHSSGN